MLVMMLVASAKEEDVTTGCGLSKERGHVISMLMLVLLVVTAEEEDVTAGCGLSKERGHVFSMMIVVNYRERYTNITMECGLREGEKEGCTLIVVG